VYHPAPMPSPMRTMPTMRKTWMLLLLATFAFTGCGIVYHAPVYQGNLLESKNVAQLKAGMSKQDVLALIGTPSIADPFHTQRWDYVETQQDGRIQNQPDIKTLTLIFNADVLASYSGSLLPDQDQALGKKMAKFGNLPKDKKAHQPASGSSSGSSGS
jgi:outer membrane protein assembly factor BamE